MRKSLRKYRILLKRSTQKNQYDDAEAGVVLHDRQLRHSEKLCVRRKNQVDPVSLAVSQWKRMRHHWHSLLLDAVRGVRRAVHGSQLQRPRRLLLQKI